MRRGALSVCWACVLLLAAVAQGAEHHAAGPRGAVATSAPEATEAALAVLQEGGNAIDAAVAAALTLGVVDGQNSGLGGGCFLLIRRADGLFVAIDGRETAPEASTGLMFVRDGRAVPELSRTGALAVGVPGALAAYEYAVKHWGRLALRTHLERAARLAEGGFVVRPGYASALKETAADLARFESTRAIFLRPDGGPWITGERVCQPDLAGSYRAIAREGTRWFYRGAFARWTGRWMADHGGLLTSRDFARYKIKLRQPIRTSYRGYEIIGFPPPSSGGVHVAQILNEVERFELGALGVGSADAVHLLAEAMKRAFADRAHWLGDPDFTAVPRGLVSKAYAADLARTIRMDRAVPVAGHGEPGTFQRGVFGGHTTHFSTADAAGNWVAGTATLNTWFGAKVVVPGTGILLNNQMDDFAAQPGVTNYFGLPGAAANAVAPGKRPLSSMSPTIVLKQGQPILAVGASGGPTIISQTVLALVNTLDFGLPLEAALRQPRFHHQWLPDELRVEAGLPPAVREQLAGRGHRVVEGDPLAATQAVGAQPAGGGFVAVSEPRSGGGAAAW